MASANPVTSASGGIGGSAGRLGERLVLFVGDICGGHVLGGRFRDLLDGGLLIGREMLARFVDCLSADSLDGRFNDFGLTLLFRGFLRKFAPAVLAGLAANLPPGGRDGPVLHDILRAAGRAGQDHAQYSSAVCTG